MKTLASFRDAGSFIAGLLIGVSFVITVFAMTVVDAARGQMVGVIIAPLVLTLALVLQFVMTRPPRRRTNGRELSASPWGSLRIRASPARASTLTGGDLQAPHQPATQVVVDRPSFKLGNLLWRGSIGALGAIGQAAIVVFLLFFLLLSGD